MIESHYLFSSECCFAEHYGSGFAGLSGSQASEISSLLLHLPDIVQKFGRWRADVSLPWFTLRRPDALNVGSYISRDEKSGSPIAPSQRDALSARIKLERSPVQRLSEDPVRVNHEELRRSECRVRLAASGEFAVKMV